MFLKGYFVQYKFIVPENTKHSEYSYQKLFRAIYGYTQKVTKSNGKTYSYHRKGILSDTPYIKQGKNCVVIPQNSFSKLKNFFLTGNNPTHSWRVKGDWKAVYYLNDKEINQEAVVKSLEDLLDRTYIQTKAREHEKIENEVENLVKQKKENPSQKNDFEKTTLGTAEEILSHIWFKENKNYSKKLSSFYQNTVDLRDSKL